MKTSIQAATVLLALLSNPASAQIAIDSIGGSDLTLEGLIQADANWYDSDVADLDGETGRALVKLARTVSSLRERSTLDLPFLIPRR